jgi:predicted signal transduction protein with EAL and GGDEF domain
MTLDKISRGNQIMIYAAISVLVVIFIIYFFRQAAITQDTIGQFNVAAKQPTVNINNALININFDLLTSSKFLSLKSQAAPAQSFPTGKRDPFEPQ